MRTDAALQSVLGRNASVFMAVRGWVVRILVVSACLGMCTFSIFSLLELKPSQRYVREAQMLAKAVGNCFCVTVTLLVRFRMD